MYINDSKLIIFCEAFSPGEYPIINLVSFRNLLASMHDANERFIENLKISE